MGGVLSATSEAELLRPRRMGNLQNAIPYVPPPMLQVTPNSNQAEKDAIIAEARRKREAIMNKLLGNTTELRDEPPPIVRSIPYSYDRDAIDKARELAEAQARIANRDYEDKVGLFKQAIKDKDDLKKEAQNKPYRKSIHRWPYPEIVEQRIKDYEITTGNKSSDFSPTPTRGNLGFSYPWLAYNLRVKSEVEALAEALVRIANRANEDRLGHQELRIRNEKEYLNMPVTEPEYSWPHPRVIRQREEDDNLVKANKEFLKANKDYLEKYNLYPAKVIDNMYKLRKTVESRPYVLHWMEDTAKKMYGEDGRGRKDDLNYKEDFMN